MSSQEIYAQLQALQQQWAKSIFSFMQSALQQNTPAFTRLIKVNQEFMAQQMALYTQYCNLSQSDSIKSPVSSASIDKRFQAQEWSHPVFNWIRDYYTIVSQSMLQWVDFIVEDTENRAKMRFFTQQFLDAMSPANFLMSNPEALTKAIATYGQSLCQSMQNFIQDNEKGYLSIVDETAFKIGENIATTAGSVIFENELMQILQYTPLTAEVFEKPLLIVPPCINKFYIMDLQPEQSMIHYLLEEKHRVFLISWKNITPDLGHMRWDDYIEKGVLKAISVVCSITKQPQVNALGYCIGGVILATAAAVAKARNKDSIAALILVASMLDHVDPGEIRFFIDEMLVKSSESRVSAGGVVKGTDLAAAFSMLRANELIWKPAIESYLLGKSPPVFALLYWNADSTNLSLPMHTFFLRNMYLENALRVPNKISLCNIPIDLRNLTMPTYFFAARDDHISPWKSVYASLKCIGKTSKPRFVLGASGHVAGVINPVHKHKRNYWINEDIESDADSWLSLAQSQPGSWWQDLIIWLKPHAGNSIIAPTRLGNRHYKPIEPAPGRYVREKIK